MGALFDRLEGLFPGQWKRNFPDVEAIQNWEAAWAEGFEQDGIVPADIKAGLDACRKLQWPPSYGQFAEACKSRKPVDGTHKSFAKLPAPVVAKDVMRRRIEELRKMQSGWANSLADGWERGLSNEQDADA